jgi:hypothetical protein
MSRWQLSNKTNRISDAPEAAFHKYFAVHESVAGLSRHALLIPFPVAFGVKRTSTNVGLNDLGRK